MDLWKVKDGIANVFSHIMRGASWIWILALLAMLGSHLLFTIYNAGLFVLAYFGKYSLDGMDVADKLHFCISAILWTLFLGQYIPYMIRKYRK